MPAAFCLCTLTILTLQFQLPRVALWQAPLASLCVSTAPWNPQFLHRTVSWKQNWYLSVTSDKCGWSRVYGDHFAVTSAHTKMFLHIKSYYRAWVNCGKWQLEPHPLAEYFPKEVRESKVHNLLNWDLHHSIRTQGRFKRSKWCPHMLTRWAN